MARFSDRYGYTTPTVTLQRESADQSLRAGLWNVLDLYLWGQAKGEFLKNVPPFNLLVFSIWHSYFKKPTDTIPDWGPDVIKVLRKYFFGSEWFEFFNFLEFVVSNAPQEQRVSLTDDCNAMLEREVSAYRLVGGRVVEISSVEEVEAIEQALDDAAKVPGVRTHLESALDLSSDRETPDYRNSIKEAISAVEAVTNRIAGTSNAPLGAALKKLGITLHPALDQAFKKLYGYTSDAQGIRHALMDEPDLEFEDAKFMLVACAGFVSYLVAKAGREGVVV